MTMVRFKNKLEFNRVYFSSPLFFFAVILKLNLSVSEALCLLCYAWIGIPFSNHNYISLDMNINSSTMTTQLDLERTPYRKAFPRSFVCIQ